MVAMPANLAVSGDTEAIRLTVEEYRCHELTLTEAKSDLALLFDASDTSLAPRLAVYLEGILARVATGEIDSGTAAGDIHRMAKAAASGDPDLACLAELGRE